MSDSLVNIYFFRIIEHIFLFAITLPGIIYLSFLFLVEKNKYTKSFLFCSLIILTSLGAYLVVNILINFFGIAYPDFSRVRENQEMLITLSRLEKIFLIFGIIGFSWISTSISESRLKKVESIVTLISGSLITLLAIFSDDFIIPELKSFDNIVFQGGEGNLFIIFMIFFAVVVLVNFAFLIFYRKKVKDEMIIKYKSIVVGLSIVIFFSILEVSELYGIIKLYPYFPPLIGTGTAFFGVVISVLVAIENRRINNKKIIYYRSLRKSKEMLRNTINNLKDLAKKTNQTIQKISTNLDKLYSANLDIGKIKSEISQNYENVTQNYKKALSLLGEIENLPDKLKIIGEKLSKIMGVLNEIKVSRENILENVKNIEINQLKLDDYKKKYELLSDKSEFIAIIVKNTRLFVSSLTNMENYSDDYKLLSVNTSIVSTMTEKRKSSTSIISDEINVITNKIIDNTLQIEKISKIMENDLAEIEERIEPMKETIPNLVREISNTLKTYTEFEFSLNKITESCFFIYNTYEKVNEMSNYMNTTLSDLVKEIIESNNFNHDITQKITLLINESSEIYSEITSKISLMNSLLSRLEEIVKMIENFILEKFESI